jgi:anti-sigma regulatory factor (Ser/Thr protein kinase)
MTVRRSFGLDRASVGASRKFVAETLADLPEDIRESAVLMMSELATNAVVHALTGFEVCIDRGATQVRVEVADVGEGEPRLRSPSSSEPHGRGLRIVEELSDEWGMVESDDHAGKSVWFAVRLDPASASEAEVAASEGRKAPARSGRSAGGRRQGASAGGSPATNRRGPRACSSGRLYGTSTSARCPGARHTRGAPAPSPGRDR